MQIIKSKFLRPRKCEFGDFELIPEKGWKLSQTFIDYESGLLIASVQDEDENNWEELGYNGRRIPSKQFVIDLKTLTILTPTQWLKYFNYDKATFTSKDNKFKLTTQRIHEPENNTDSIYEELEYLDTGIKSTSTGIAFRKEKRENLLERVYRQIKEIEEQKKTLDAKPNIEQFYENQLKTLKENDVIIGYTTNSETYKLSFIASNYILYKSDNVPSEYGQWKTMEFFELRKYSTLEDFWEDLTKDSGWFLELRLHQSISEKPLIMARHMITYFNNLRKEHKFTYKEYDSINEWENSVWSEEYKPTEFKQWCSNCHKEVYYYARYPKYICKECSSKEILDNNGNLLDFSNLGFSGGLKIIRKNRLGEIIEEDNTKQFCYCLIEGKEYFAEEAKFGGIVIQQKE